MKKKDKYSMQQADRIIRYRSGKMTDSERNAFERELQKDPFLAEALEGLSGLSEEELQSDIDKLGGRLESISRKRTPVYYRIAAAVIVLLGISSILLIRQLKGPELVSDNLQFSEDSLSASAPESSQNIIEDLTEKEEAVESKNIEKENELVERSKQIDNAIDIEEEELRVELNPILLDEVSMKEEVALEIIADSSSEIIEMEAGDINSALAGKVAGVQVVESQAMPESVSLKKSDSNVRSVALDARKTKEAIQDEIALEEVVVITSGDENKERTDSYIKAAPETGIRDFRKYIEANIQFPEEWIDSDREVVRLKFIINPDNTLSNFEIVRSPDILFSTEAIRLIKEGPAWTPARLNNTYIEETASLRIVFKR